MIKQPLTEWKTEAIARFGSDPSKWAFICPKCGNVQTAADFGDIEDGANKVYQACVGRHVENKGCDWAAYGFLGTLGKGRIVLADDREVEVFDFAEAGGTRHE
ncbi:VVA0879 family protein [Paenibacillus massiliensis]|uniref:VVA0879 family protein n=1 Tax=Paenibacillus massiliensis TaxID=225917 RepID=UPI0003FF62E3|nr:VVA0879 family protein [Paenibacillus massiliensis]